MIVSHCTGAVTCGGTARAVGAPRCNAREGRPMPPAKTGCRSHAAMHEERTHEGARWRAGEGASEGVGACASPTCFVRIDLITSGSECGLASTFEMT
eukprot:786082-Prymnesium_polylepis.1